MLRFVLLVVASLLMCSKAFAQAAAPQECRGVQCLLKGKIKIVIKPARPVVKKPKRPVKKKIRRTRPKKAVKKRRIKRAVRKPKRTVRRKKVAVTRPVKKAPVLLGPSWEGLEVRPVITLSEEELLPLDSTFIVRLNPNVLAAQGVVITVVTPAALATFLGLEPFQVRSIQRRFLPGAILYLSEAQRAALANNPAVVRVTPDTVIKPAANKANRLSWGLDRIDQRELPLNGKFSRQRRRGNLRVYLLDSGVDRTHPEFNDRVVFGASFVPVIPTGSDAYCRLHGTEMASLITGHSLGVASDVRLIDVTVLPCVPDETGSASSLIEGLYWVAERENALRPRKLSVVNLSITGPKSIEVNEWVDAVSNLGIAVVVAAGNQGDNSCNYSPASAQSAITIGALNEKDIVTDFSNRGSCVRLNAPGFKVSAASAANHAAAVATSGTSAAAAYVSGILASNLSEIEQGRGAELLTSNAVNIADEDQPLMLVQAQSSIRVDCRVRSNVRTLNLRKKPNTSASVLEQLTGNSAVELYKTEGNWANVRVASGNKGWVALSSKSKALLIDSRDEETCRGR